MCDAPAYSYDALAHKFTGKERDSESGLDEFGARYYGSSLGRFMTPDWAAKPVPRDAAAGGAASSGGKAGRAGVVSDAERSFGSVPRPQSTREGNARRTSLPSATLRASRMTAPTDAAASWPGRFAVKIPWE